MDNQAPIGKNLSASEYSKLRRTQKRRVQEYLKDHVATASMVTEAIGIPQKCVTRYKRELEDSGKLHELMKAKCKITGFPAWYLTCNPELFPPSASHQIADFFKRLFSNFKRKGIANV